MKLTGEKLRALIKEAWEESWEESWEDERAREDRDETWRGEPEPEVEPDDRYMPVRLTPQGGLSFEPGYGVTAVSQRGFPMEPQLKVDAEEEFEHLPKGRSMRRKGRRQSESLRITRGQLRKIIQEELGGSVFGTQGQMGIRSAKKKKDECGDDAFDYEILVSGEEPEGGS